jgi:hypothetical protein
METDGGLISDGLRSSGMSSGGGEAEWLRGNECSRRLEVDGGGGGDSRSAGSVANAKGSEAEAEAAPL